MTDLIGHIGNTMTLANGLYEIAKEYNNSVLIRQISDLNIQLAQTQNMAAQMTTELQTLKTEIEEQQNNPLEYDGRVYRDKGNIPYCPGCYDDRRKRIHLRPYPMMDLSYQCPVCKTDYDDY